MKAVTAKPAAPRLAPVGKLEWRSLIQGLREDGLVSAEDADQTARRFAGGQSAQHPLVRIASVNLLRAGTTKPLDVEALTEWLAGRVGLPYLRIDPLRVDVGRVAEIMSITYAERRRALPLTVGLHDVTIATCEPLDIGWVAEIEAHARKAVKLVVASPPECVSRLAATSTRILALRAQIAKSLIMRSHFFAGSLKRRSI